MSEMGIPGKRSVVLICLLLAAVIFFGMWTGNWPLLMFPLIVVFGYTAWQTPRLAFYLLLITIPFSFEFNLNEGLSIDLPDEILMLLVSFLVLASFIHNPGRIKVIIRQPLVQWLLAWMLWMFVASIFSSHPIISLKFILSKGWYIGAFLLAPILFWDSKEAVRISAKLFLCSMLAVVLVIMIRHGMNGFRFETINDAVAPFFRNHVNYAAMLVCTFPLLFALFRRAGKQTRTWIIISNLLIFLPALFFSYSRGAWLALGAGLIGWWLIKKRKLVMMYVVTVLFSIVSLVWLSGNDRYLGYAHDFNKTIFHKDFREHLVATYQMKDISAAERFNRWVAAVRMTTEEPFTGFGPGTFYNNYKSYTVPAFKTWVSNNPEKSTAHNYFLLTASEQGIPGLLLLLVLLGICLWYAQYLYHYHTDPFYKMMAIVAGTMVVMIITLNLLSDLIETDKIGSLFFLSMSMLIVAGRRARVSEKVWC